MYTPLPNPLPQAGDGTNEKDIKSTKPLRESMPLVTAFIDECREAFGAEMVNAQIKLGMQGAQTFHARENGIEVGTPFAVPVKYITLDKMVIRDKPAAADKRK